MSESMRTSTLAHTLSDTEVNTAPASATTRKEKKNLTCYWKFTT